MLSAELVELVELVASVWLPCLLICVLLSNSNRPVPVLLSREANLSPPPFPPNFPLDAPKPPNEMAALE
jgi:hypothetical protein